jgi:hypothetical protein
MTMFIHIKRRIAGRDRGQIKVYVTISEYFDLAPDSPDLVPDSCDVIRY